MPDSEIWNPAHIEQLLAEGKFIDALQIVETFEQRTSLEPIDRLACQNFKSTLFNKLGRYEEAVTLAEQTFKESKNQNMTLQMIDALLAKVEAFSRIGKLDESLKLICQAEELFNLVRTGKDLKSGRRRLFRLRRRPSSQTASQEQATELAQIEASLNHHKGCIYWYKGDLDYALQLQEKSLGQYTALGDKIDIANSLINIGAIHVGKGDLNRGLEFYQKCLVLFQELGNKKDIARSFNNIGVIYQQKGELERALEYYQQSGELFKELGNKLYIAASVGNIGEVYRQKGDLEPALEYLEQSMNLFEESGNTFYSSENLFRLISAALDVPSVERAQKYLERLKQLNDHEDTKITSHRYRVAEALVLKESTRARNWVKAQEIFEKIISEEVVDHEVSVVAMLNLCELLLVELRTSGDTEVLGEIQNLVNRLMDIAKQQHSHSLLTEVSLLKSKLALVELDVKGARQLLTQAELIAEEQGLHRLAVKVSIEHDALLGQLNKWEELIERDASMSERAKLARFEDIMSDMIRKREYEIPELPAEDPVWLLILNDGGLCLYSKTFLSKGELDDQLIGGFLTAIQAFSSEVFAQSLDRVKLEEYTLLMKSEKPFLICYVFKGQSYSAHKKLAEFGSLLRNNAEVWQALSKASASGQQLDGVEHSDIRTLLDGVFH